MSAKTQIAILWVMALVVLGIFAMVAYSATHPAVADGAGKPEATPTPTPEVYNLPEIAESAWGLYPLAEERAKAWREDAVLVSASGRWGLATPELMAQPTTWAYQFYSPAGQRVAVVMVAPDRQVTWVRDAVVPYAMHTVGIEAWKVDSVVVLEEWLSRGGGRFLRLHPRTDVHAQLYVEEGAFRWTVSGVELDGDAAFVLSFDAATGQLIAP